MKIDIAGIVLFNPDIPRLKENISAILPQVSTLILIDNNSKNIYEIEQLVDSLVGNIFLIKNDENRGIATALNQICNLSMKLSYDWCVLFDQDSICSSNMIEDYSLFVDNANIAILSPYIVDEYKTTLQEYHKKELPTLSESLYAITSGSLVKLTIWKEVGGFMEDLFIDGVDSEYSYRVRDNGYTIQRVNSVYIMHQQGEKTEATKIYRIHKDESGKRTIKPAFRFNYSHLRWYYMARNNLIIIKKYKHMNGLLLPLVRYIIRFASVLLIENHKLELFKNIWRGIKDGLSYSSKSSTK